MSILNILFDSGYTYICKLLIMLDPFFYAFKFQNYNLYIVVDFNSIN